MNFKNLLNGLKLGEKQEVGVMSVIPLLGEDVHSKLGVTSDIRFDGTHTYGVMVVSNETEKPVITPSGYSIITNQMAQDHATPFAHLVQPNTNRKHIDVACCIEETQGGYIDGGNNVNKFNLLPLYVKKEHFKKFILSHKDNDDFGRLWNIISKFQNKLVEQHNAHLVYFFNKYMSELSQFNAEFEVVPEQRGAIILLNDKVVGIEITPSHNYWKELWKPLIRDVYGSEVIRMANSKLIEEFKKHTEVELSLEDCKTIEEIEKALEEHSQKNKVIVSDILADIQKDNYQPIKAYKNVVDANKSLDLEYNLFSNEKKSSFGEIFTSKENNEVVYCSMMFN